MESASNPFTVRLLAHQQGQTTGRKTSMGKTFSPFGIRLLALHECWPLLLHPPGGSVNLGQPFLILLGPGSGTTPAPFPRLHKGFGPLHGLMGFRPGPPPSSTRPGWAFHPPGPSTRRRTPCPSSPSPSTGIPGRLAPGYGSSPGSRSTPKTPGYPAL